VTEVLEAENLPQVLQVLNIEQDDSELFVVLEGELLALNDAMNLEDLTKMLNMTEEELVQIISKLTGEQTEGLDIWNFLEQSPQLLAQLTAVLQGDNQVITPKEAGQIAKFIQLAQMVGQKVDTVYQQEVVLMNTKESLQQFLQQLPKPEIQEQPKQVTPNTTFAQVVQQSQQQVQSQTTENTEAAPNIASQTAPQQNVRTVSVVLPMERSAQSEALMKELQNQLNRAQIANNNGVIKLTMRLFPENLGQIRVEIMQQDGVMQARILATTPAGKELLDSNLNQLKNTLVAQNIQLDRLDIAQALQTADASKEQNFFNQFFKQEQQELEDKEEETDEEEISFEDLLNQQMELEEV
jgi:flagellar hook-length control protein FliK